MANKIQLKDNDGNNIYPIVLAEHMTGLLSTEDVEDINNEFDETVLNLIYPIGSLYWSGSPTSPAILFGGTWEQIKDKFVLSAGSNYTNGSTGGSATHTHGAKNSQNGSLEALIGTGNTGVQTIGFSASNLNTRLVSTYKVNCPSYVSGTTNTYNTLIYGETASSSSMPPYIVKYCWERTA